MLPGILIEKGFNENEFTLSLEEHKLIFSVIKGKLAVEHSKYSPSYGVMLDNQCLVIESIESVIEWKIVINKNER